MLVIGLMCVFFSMVQIIVVMYVAHHDLVHVINEDGGDEDEDEDHDEMKQWVEGLERE